MDHDTRRKKQKALITELLERKIRLHAQQIYDRRGDAEGSELQDWTQAESEVLGNSILAPVYRRARAENGVSEPDARDDDSHFVDADHGFSGVTA